MTFLIFKKTVQTGLLILSVGIIANLSGCDLLNSEEKSAHGAKAGMARPLPQVGVLKVEPTKVPNIFSVTGRAEAFTIAEIRPQVEGIIIKRNFEEGTSVKKGDLLYELDPSSYQALYDSAKAAIAKSEALLTNAKIKVKRNERLVRIKAVSEQVMDDARASLREAKANLAADKAALKTTKINLERTKIKSPVSGLIGRSNITKGALVTTNQATSLASVQQFNPIYVDFSVPSYYAISLKKQIAKNKEKDMENFPVTIEFDDGSKYQHTGKIKLSEFKVDRSTDSIILRTQFPNPDSLLLPGMFIHGSVMTGFQENIYLVPGAALSRTPQGSAFVMVLTEDGTVSVRPVKENGFYEDKWIISSGLNTGDQVIVKGIQYIRPGVKATIIGAKPTTVPTAKGK